MTGILSFLQILSGLFRELADENAYRRHLAKYGRTHSPKEWRHFFERRLSAKYSSPRCC
jgi:hypothetical protein